MPSPCPHDDFVGTSAGNAAEAGAYSWQDKQVTKMDYESLGREQKIAFWRKHPLNGVIEIDVPSLPRIAMRCDNDDTVVKELYWTDFTGWEFTSLTLWAQSAERAVGLVLDVGAYTGIYGLVAAAANAETQVTAFDVQPVCVNRIKENARINGFENLVACELAASDVAGDVTFYYYSEPDIISSVASLTPNRYSTTSGRARAARLDDVVGPDRAGDVSLVKIDVEGAELRVLKGMPTILDESRPDVLIEVNDLSRLPAVRRCFPKGYVDYQIDDRSYSVSRTRKLLPRSRGRNYLFVGSGVEPVLPLRGNLGVRSEDR